MSGYNGFTATDVCMLSENCYDLKVYEESKLPRRFGFTYCDQTIEPAIIDLNVSILKDGKSHDCKIVADKTVMTGSGDLVHISEDTYENIHGLYWLNHAVEAKLGLVGYEYRNSSNDPAFYISEVNYHPFSAQTFVPESKCLDYYYIVLAEPYNSNLFHIDEDLKVFKIPGHKSLYIHPGVWHCPPIVFKACTGFSKISMTTSQSREHGCVIYDILDKCGTLARFHI